MQAIAHINGKDVNIFVHSIERKDGEAIAICNKGDLKTFNVFAVKVSVTNIIMA